MTASTNNKTSWVWMAWLVQLGTFIPFTFLCLRSIGEMPGNKSLLFVLGSTTLWLLVALLNAVLIRGKAQSFLAFITVLVNPYLIPLSIYVSYNDHKTAVIFSIAYCLIIIAATPKDVGLCVFLSGLSFAILQKFLIADIKDTPTKPYIMHLTLAYLGLGITALAWRFLLNKLYEILTGTPEAKQEMEQQSSESQRLAQELSKLAGQHRKLKEAVAEHMAKLNQLSGHKRTEAAEEQRPSPGTESEQETEQEITTEDNE